MMAFSKSKVVFLCWACLALAQSQAFSAYPAQTEENKPTVKLTIVGEIVSAEGPVSGATVKMFRDNVFAQAVSNDDGKFQIELDSDKPVKLLVFAEGKISRIRLLDPKTETNVRVQLKGQKAPLQGRIIDYQGMGVADAKLRVVSVSQRVGQETAVIEIPVALKHDRFDASTDENGHFQFDGMEASMIGTISISGQGIVTSPITSESFSDEIVMVAQPARIVRGKVIDQKTNQPISNAMVSAGSQQARSDDSGEFEMSGLPAFQPLQLSAIPNGEQPYLQNSKQIPNQQGFDPINVEIGLEPGAWVDCNVKDFGTGGPARAEVFYFPTPENEDFQRFVESLQLRGVAPSSSTNAQGVAKIVAIPGPGVIAVVAQGFPPNESVNKLTDEQRAMLLGITRRNDLTAVKWIDPKNLGDKIELDFLVSKGRSIDIELPFTQLESTSNLIVHRAASKSTYGQPITGTKIIAEQFQPGEKRQILIHAAQKELGAVLDVDAEAKSPVKAVLEPTGRVGGQVVNKNGDPQSGLVLQFEIQSDDGYQEIATQIFTDANGRFEKPSLIAALEYRVAAVRLTKNQSMLMEGSPIMDSRWYIAENLKVNSGEAVDLGTIVLEATHQPEPKRSRRIEVADSSDLLPPVIRGVITDESGEPMANALVSFNTWPNRSDDLETDRKLKPIVLAQSRSDSNGNFQMTINAGLEEKLVVSDADKGKRNVAIVAVAEKYGTFQIQLAEVDDPQNIQIQLNLEMVVRGKISLIGDAATQKSSLTLGSRMQVYDVDSITQIIAGLQQGSSLEAVTKQFQPISTLDPLAGGLPLAWETSASGVFLVRNIPRNAIFEVHAIGESSQEKTITVISRPIRGFDFKPFEDSSEESQLQGSRIRLNLGQQK